MEEKRLIDADKIYDAIERRYQVSSGIEHRCERDFLDLICASDTVDAVEVVRCRDCKHWDSETWFCDNHSTFGHHGLEWNMFSEDDFCSYGERKDGDVDG